MIPDQALNLATRMSDASRSRGPVLRDEGVVLTFGMFQGTLEEPREAQREFDYDAQMQAVTPYVEEVLFDGAFEVVEERS